MKQIIKSVFVLACLSLTPNIYADMQTGAQPAPGAQNPPASAVPGTVPTPYGTTLDSTPQPKPTDTNLMEKCRVVDSNGNGLIRAYMADSGNNLEGDATAWIWVPYGQCTKINAGDFSGVSPDVRNKIQMSNVQNANTLE